MKMTISNMKITGSNRQYILNKMQNFADLCSAKKFSEVQIGRPYEQGFSISLISHNGQSDNQAYFESKEYMIGYIVGYVIAAENQLNHTIKEL